MKDIARELGVQAPSLYNYVESKRRLLDVLCVEAMRDMRDALRGGIAMGTDAADGVLRGMEAQVRFRLRRPYHLQVVTRESLHLAPGVREEVLSLRDEQRGMWREVVLAGVTRAGSPRRRPSWPRTCCSRCAAGCRSCTSRCRAGSPRISSSTRSAGSPSRS